MVARIRQSGKTYHSVVLAIVGRGWHCKFVVWDPFCSNVILIPEWGHHHERQVYVLDAGRRGWMTHGKMEGIPEIVNAPSVLRQIRRGRCPAAVFQIAQKLQKEVVPREWYPLENEQHVESFASLTFDLHDAYITGIRPQGQDAEIVIDTTWQCVVTLRCTGVTENTFWRGMAIDDTGNYFAFSDDGTVTVTFEPLVWEGSAEEQKLVCRHLEYSVTTDPEILRQIRETYDEWCDETKNGNPL